MKKTLVIALFVLTILVFSDGKKMSRSRGSSRGTSRRTSYNPQPTSLSHPQPASAPKPSLFGWQEKPAQRTQTSSRQSNPSNKQTHSYPSSNTGLSGNKAKSPTNQESIQKSSAPQNAAGQSQNQPSHSYPSSKGLSGTGGAGYPQQSGSGLSGTGVAPPPYSSGGNAANNFGSNHHAQGPPPPYSPAAGAGYPRQQGSGAAAPPPYSSGNYYGGNYHHPQGVPPSYGAGGYGGYSPQMPGYFGNYGNNGGHGRGFGGVSRSGSALTGVGIAGAGVGTLLTGLALWNLARSTGRHQHTVIYDNRGQPVAVAPSDNSQPVTDPILGDLVNCSLTISNDNATEVLAIPCAIATSFTPEADVKDVETNINTKDNTKCTVTVVNKSGKEFMTTIPCSILLNTAAENNVTEPPPMPVETTNGTLSHIDDGNASITTTTMKVESSTFNVNCSAEPGDIRDPINPCFAVTHNLTVISMTTPDNNDTFLTTPVSA